MIYENILQTIGNTPLVRINKLNPNKNVAIYAKIEGNNPTGSIKDRIALKMVEQAEAEGLLVRGKTIIDKITLGYEKFILGGVLNELSQTLDADIRQEDNNIDLVFQPRFLTYVQWLYFSAVEQIQQVTGKPKTMDIYARQLFEDAKNTFVLRFNESCLVFENRRNIEDTLFLDLQRYCEHNRIHYEVK